MTTTQSSEQRGQLERYLTYGPLDGKRGFLHQWNNICITCTESLYNKRIPVLPRIFTLPESHNPAGSIDTHWDRYWDIENMRAGIFRYTSSDKILDANFFPFYCLWVDDVEDWLSKKSHKIIETRSLRHNPFKDQSVKMSEILYIKPHTRLWRLINSDHEGKQILKRNFLEKVTRRLKHHDITSKEIFIAASPSREVCEVVEDIVAHLGKHFWALHVRRGDLLVAPRMQMKYPHAPYASSIPWILANLECSGLSKDTPIFLMTDERKPGYFDALYKKFNIMQATDFESFRKASAFYPKDNFFRYHIERQVYLQAARRYRTATYYGRKLEFSLWPERQVRFVHELPPHAPMPAHRRGAYLSYLSKSGELFHSGLSKAVIPLWYEASRRYLLTRLFLRKIFNVGQGQERDI